MKAKVVASSTDNLTIDRKDIGYAFTFGDEVDVTKWVDPRSLLSNSFLFALYRYIIDNGGRSKGHHSEIGLHESMKIAYAEENPSIGYVKTSRMGQKEFNEFIEYVDYIANTQIGVNTAEFHERNKHSGINN